MNVENGLRPKNKSLESLKISHTPKPSGHFLILKGTKSPPKLSNQEAQVRTIKGHLKSRSSFINSTKSSNAMTIIDSSSILESIGSRKNTEKLFETIKSVTKNIKTQPGNEKKTENSRILLEENEEGRVRRSPQREETIITLPPLRYKPARHIRESYQQFKTGIYQTLYSPLKTAKNKKVIWLLNRHQSSLFQSYSNNSNEQPAAILKEPEQLFVSPFSKSPKIRSPVLEGPKELENEQKNYIAPFIAKEFMSSFEYPTIEALSKEVLELFKSEEFRHVFTELEVKLLESSVSSFKTMNPELYSFLIKDITRSKITRGEAIGKQLTQFLVRLARVRSPDLRFKELFSKRPHEKENSVEFFDAIKQGKNQKVMEMAAAEPCLVFDYDYVRMTPLHWAAKKNNAMVCDFFLEKGADVNVKDCLGRIPLYFAMENQNIEIVRTFLLAKASPWSIPGVNYDQVCKGDQRVKHFIQKSRELHIILQISDSKEKAAIWEREAPAYFGDRKKGKIFLA